MFEILLHQDFLSRASKTLRRYRPLRQQLVTVLNRLEQGPGSAHSAMKGSAVLGSRGIFRRMRVAGHRMIYWIDEREKVIVPVFLSDRPRNEATYRDWMWHASEIMSDYERRPRELFEEWQGTL